MAQIQPPSSPTPSWRPGRHQQAFLWWLRLGMRYGVGGGGLVWEILIDQLHQPLALFVFGAIASGTDLVGYAVALIRPQIPTKDEDEHDVD